MWLVRTGTLYPIMQGEEIATVNSTTNIYEHPTLQRRPFCITTLHLWILVHPILHLSKNWRQSFSLVDSVCGHISIIMSLRMSWNPWTQNKVKTVWTVQHLLFPSSMAQQHIQPRSASNPKATHELCQNKILRGEWKQNDYPLTWYRKYCKETE